MNPLPPVTIILFFSLLKSNLYRLYYILEVNLDKIQMLKKIKNILIPYNLKIVPVFILMLISNLFEVISIGSIILCLR